MLPKEISPYPNGRVGDDSDITNEYKKAEDRLLKPGQDAQVDRAQTGLSHGTGTKEDGVDIAKSEQRFGMAIVAMDAAAVHDDRRDDDSQEEVSDVHAIEVHFEAAMSLQIQHCGVDATHDGEWR